MKISILMCVKNGMPYIMASVNSFLKQDYKDKELIIIYSIDSTLASCKIDFCGHIFNLILLSVILWIIHFLKIYFLSKILQ